jgi:hypothetical protein
MVVMPYFGDHPPPHVHVRVGRRVLAGPTSSGIEGDPEGCY